MSLESLSSPADEKRGYFGRAVDSFKPPTDQIGWVPERLPYIRDATPITDVDMAELGENLHTATHDSTIGADDVDDNGGLKRALHGRHLQVRVRHF